MLISAAEMADRHRDAWLELLARSNYASPEMHPEHAVSTDSIVYARFEADQMTALAVLAPKTTELSRARGLRRLTRLTGRRLVGNRMLGDDDLAAVSEFADAIADLLEGGDADLLLIEDLDTASQLAAELRDLPNHRSLDTIVSADPQPHWSIHFPEPAQDYWGKFKRKSRYNLRRRVKQLEHTLVRVDSAEQVGDFLRQAEAVSRKSWQGRRLGVRICDNDASRNELETWASLGALRAYLLMQGERPIAFAYAVQLGGYFQYEEIGYDPEYRDSGPGEVLLYRIIEDCIDHQCPKVFDFGAGDAVYKRKFANHESQSGPLLLVGQRLRPRAAVTVDRLRAQAERHARTLLRRTGLYAKVRKLYRR